MGRIRLLITTCICLLWSGCAGPTTSSSGPTPAGRSRVQPPPSTGYATYYVRPDGGSAAQCNGLVNAPHTGASRDCAWDHPFRALPPAGPPRIAGGDTLVIGSGSYMIGYGAPEADRKDDSCSQDNPWDCTMLPVPSGPDPGHPTRILGSGWDRGCPQPPALWGTERVARILDLAGTENAEIACLEITDHAGCAEHHAGGLACHRDAFPYGSWAPVGVYAADSSDVLLRDLDIHGLASTGVHAGRLTDWTLENVRIAGNGWAGWDGDLWEGSSSNTGTLRFRNWTVEWNGCVETWPEQAPAGCWAQTAGGYGDGVGTAATGGVWIIEDSSFLHNTSDGLDLLYHTEGGSVSLERVRAEGNAGNQVKVTGPVTITNSVLVGNCAYFENQPFTYHVDPCRALGNTLEIMYTGGDQASIVNTTFYGQGDGLVGAGAHGDFQCDGSETLTGSNNVFEGDDDFFSPGDITFLFYQDNCGDLLLSTDYSIAYRVKNHQAPYALPPFPSAHNMLQDPVLAGPLAGNRWGMGLTPTSPAIDAANNDLCPIIDLVGVARPIDGDGDGVAICDMGAYEWWQPTAWRYLPIILSGHS